MSQLVRYAVADGIAEIVLDDGKVNAMSTPMLHAVGEAFERARADEAIAILRSARAGIFSAGFDPRVLNTGDPAERLEMVRTGADLVVQLMEHPLPTLALIEGHAFPMGAFLTLACDLRIGVEGDYGIGLNEVAIGITPPTFAIELARSRLHPAWLSRTVTTGAMFRPAEALTAGFFDVLVPPAGREDALGEALATLRRIHRLSHASAKQRLRQSAVAALRSAIDAELAPGGAVAAG